MVYETKYGEVLQHHGVKGMKWGVRKKYDLASTKRAMSEAARHKSAFDKYSKQYNKQKSVGNNDKHMKKFVEHEKKVSKQSLDRAISMMQKMRKTYGDKSVKSLEKFVIGDKKSGKVTGMTDPTLYDFQFKLGLLVGPILSAPISMAKYNNSVNDIYKNYRG